MLHLKSKQPLRQLTLTSPLAQGRLDVKKSPMWAIPLESLRGKAPLCGARGIVSSYNPSVVLTNDSSPYTGEPEIKSLLCGETFIVFSCREGFFMQEAKLFSRLYYPCAAVPDNLYRHRLCRCNGHLRFLILIASFFT